MGKMLFVFGVLGLFFSCSSISISGDPESQEMHTDGEGNETQDEWGSASKRLESLIDSTKDASIHTKNYLASDLFLKADSASKSGDSVTSIFLYKHLLKMKPNDGFLLKKYGMELMRMGKMVEAKDVFLRLKNEKQFKKFYDEKIKFLLASIHATDQENEKAASIYRDILVKNSSSVEACIFLAKAYSDLNQFPRAIKRLNLCQRKNPKDASYTYYIGKFYLSKEKSSKAMSAFKKAWKIDKTHHPSALAIGLIHEEREQVKLAIKVYKRFLKIDEDTPTILSRIVNLLFADSKFKEVIPYAEKLSYLEPHDLNLKVKLGILYSDSKEFNKAIEIFTDLHKSIPESDKILFYLGSIYQETNQYEKAIDYFSKIQTDSSLFADGNIQIGEMLKEMALNKKARNKNSLIQRFLDFTGNRLEIEELQTPMTILRANFYEDSGEYAKAASEVEKIKDAKEYGENQAYYLAILFEKSKQMKKAVTIMNEILVNNPNNAHALNYLGYSYLEQGENMNLAYDYIKRAIKILPEDGYIRDSLGWYYYKVGNFEKALVELKKAYKHIKNDMVISKHLGLLYKKLKKYNLARKYFDEAIKLSTKESDKKDIANLINQLENARLPASKK